MSIKRKRLRHYRMQWRYGWPNHMAWTRYLWDVACRRTLCGHPRPGRGLHRTCDRPVGHTGNHVCRKSLGPRWWLVRERISRLVRAPSS